MKLADLFEETKDEYLDRLTRDFNIKELGSGYFATVFQHPAYHNVAVKFVQHDPGYMRYIKLVMTNQNNRWLPKVIGINKVKLKNSIAHLVFFQKLRTASTRDIKAATDEILFSLSEEDLEFILDGESLDYTDFSDFSISDWAFISQKSKVQDIRELAKVLYLSRAEDIGASNVMMRVENGKSQLVFTDPVAE